MPGKQRARADPHAGENAALEVLAEAGSARQATRRLMDLLAVLFDARYAVLWTLDETAMLLRFSEDHASDAGVQELADTCRRLSFPRGAGLPGRVWEVGEPIWVADVLDEDQRFARSQLASDLGLDMAVAVPVYGRTTLLGVMELFAAGSRPEDARAVQRLRTIARLLGEYLEHRRAEERLATSEGLRAAMVNAALDCIVTIDGDSRVIDFNPAAERTFGYPREQAVGANLAELIIPERHRGAHFAAVARLLEGAPPRLLDRRIELEATRADGTELPVELTITRIDAPDGPLFVGFLRDITERRQSREQLERLLRREHGERVRAEQAEQRAQRIAQTLQRSLLPPRLPEVRGVELAAGFRAGGHETQVGGDFYDIFESRPGRWAWVIGDVCGKGAEAASMTALARYTVRAAAMREESPSHVLQALNEALLREPAAGGFLTAAYGELDLTSAPARLMVAVGGHPPPLILRRDGDVETIEPSGTLLGVVEQATSFDIAVTLAPGDALVAYTDGVIEAHTEEGGRLELEGLVSVLRGARGRSASEVGALIERAATPRRPRPTDDDVAFLVVRLEDRERAGLSRPG